MHIKRVEALNMCWALPSGFKHTFGNTGADLEVKSFMIYILCFEGGTDLSMDIGLGIWLKVFQISKNI